ncbi:MAG: hypothetical protein U0893_19285 [Chloroflexota bacterium]
MERGLRDELHALVEKLTDDQLHEAQIALLDVLAPYDDEPLTQGELEALERSERSDGRDRIEHEEVRRRVGRPARSA